MVEYVGLDVSKEETALTLIVIYIAALHVEDHSGCMFPPCY